MLKVSFCIIVATLEQFFRFFHAGLSGIGFISVPVRMKKEIAINEKE